MKAYFDTYKEENINNMKHAEDCSWFKIVKNGIQKKKVSDGIIKEACSWEKTLTATLRLPS